MKVIGLDFETYYDKEYSLRKMTPVEYVLDPRFEAIGCAVSEPDKPTYWVEGPDLPAFFEQLDRDVATVTHNALFDNCIMAWRYDYVPRLMIDTLGISRACLGHVLRSVSLASVAKHLDLGVKGGTVANVIGMSLAAIKAQPSLYLEYQSYSMNDCELALGIFNKLVREDKLFPVSELAVQDMVLRCAVLPKFKLDMTVLAEHLNQVRADKAALLARAGLQTDENGKVPELMSAEKFAALLEGIGIDPPRKLSLTTGKETFAFAKSDPQFIELADHENPAVQALVGARLGHKSTLEETRTERLLKVSRLWWPELGPAAFMPIPLNFSAAHTHRLGGAWKLNMQNLPRKSRLRSALIAPPGCQVVAGDASQIEARIVAWISGQKELLSAFETGEDVYASFASDVYGFEVNKNDHPTERFVGKTGILGLGYGVGWPKFQRTVGLAQIELSDEDAKSVVHTYRVTKYPEIPALWKALNDEGIPALAGRSDAWFTIGPCQFETGAVLLPSGLRLKYHNLSYGDEGWTFTYAGNIKRIYGGALLENIVQALARIVTMDAGVRIQKRLAKLGIWLNLQSHDELVYIVPDEYVDVVKKVITHEMSRRPTWAPDLPLASEVGHGQSYAEAK